MSHPRKIALSLLALVAVMIGVGLFLPTTYAVSRSATISAPAPVLYAHVSDLEKYERWQPWRGDDPEMITTFGLITQGAGASYQWQSESHGAGTLTVVEATPTSRVVFDMDFDGHGSAAVTFRFVDQGDATEVTWSMTGDMQIPVFGGYFAAMMDGVVGPTYERGLSALAETVSAAD